MKTEAERRFEMFLQRGGFSPIEANHAKAIIHAIFDPLPEPEPVKSLGRVLYDIQGGVDWSEQSVEFRERCEADAQAFIATYEARRPKPTVEEVARAQFQATNSIRWEGLDQYRRDAWLCEAAAVFPLFGVTP